MKTPSLLVLPLLLLFGCAHGGTPKAAGDPMAVVSLLGDEIVLDVGPSSSWFGSDREELKVPGWKVDETFQALLGEAAKERGVPAASLALDPTALATTRKVRESRWKRVLGRHSQALVDLLLREAGRQGVARFVLLEPLADRDDDPRDGQVIGVACADRKERASPALAFFRVEVSLWDVASARALRDVELSEGPLPPALGSCQGVEDLRGNPAALEAPMKAAMRERAEAWATRLWGPASVPAAVPPVGASPWVQQ